MTDLNLIELLIDPTIAVVEAMREAPPAMANPPSVAKGSTVLSDLRRDFLRRQAWGSEMYDELAEWC